MNDQAGTIVVGVDGSEQSERALSWAVEQAVAEHRPMTLVQRSTTLWRRTRMDLSRYHATP
jgi:nucleotide-binding universal stress UspA family protein